MPKKIYICSECGFVFPEELTELIEEGTQVYCEQCGVPFSLDGKTFNKKEFKPIKEKKYPKHFKKERSSDNTYSSLNRAIQKLNDFSYVPVIIVSIIIFILSIEIAFNLKDWIFVLVRQLSLGSAGILIAYYDKKFISEKIQHGNYGSVLLDSFCIGILGCILFGSGIFILLKGILLIIFVFLNKKQQKLSAYDIGILFKDSLNNFSSKAGFIIILFAIAGIFRGRIKLLGISLIELINTVGTPFFLIFIILNSINLLMAIISLLFDYYLRDKIEYKDVFSVSDGVRTFILGVLGTIFQGAGIFILLKGILIFILYFGKPSDYEERQISKETVIKDTKKPIRMERGKKVDEKELEKDVPESSSHLKPEEYIQKDKNEEIKEEIKKIVVEEKEKEEKIKKEEDFELKLHESLLPVKNEKDKKLVKEYFSRIFNLLSKDLRSQIRDLKIPKKEKKEILKELVFLTKEKQVKYIESIINLYREEIPQELAERIRKLPNVKPEHYNKIIEELKYMDIEEQFKFVQFLEKHA